MLFCRGRAGAGAGNGVHCEATSRRQLIANSLGSLVLLRNQAISTMFNVRGVKLTERWYCVQLGLLSIVGALATMRGSMISTALSFSDLDSEHRVSSQSSSSCMPLFSSPYGNDVDGTV